jgi:isoleucyl-tRNA synthetase
VRAPGPLHEPASHPAAVTVAFPLVDDPSIAFLAWTTTPWTLPSNLALCVHPDFDYVQIEDAADGRKYILLAALLKTLYKDPKKALKEGKYKQIAKYKGAELKGKRYTPPFPYFHDKVPSALCSGSSTPS